MELTPFGLVKRASRIKNKDDTDASLWGMNSDRYLMRANIIPWNEANSLTHCQTSCQLSAEMHMCEAVIARKNSSSPWIKLSVTTPVTPLNYMFSQYYFLISLSSFYFSWLVTIPYFALTLTILWTSPIELGWATCHTRDPKPGPLGCKGKSLTTRPSYLAIPPPPHLTATAI